MTSRRELTWSEESHYDFDCFEVGVQVDYQLEHFLIDCGLVVLVKLYLKSLNDVLIFELGIVKSKNLHVFLIDLTQRLIT